MFALKTITLSLVSLALTACSPDGAVSTVSLPPGFDATSDVGGDTRIDTGGAADISGDAAGTPDVGIDTGVPLQDTTGTGQDTAEVGGQEVGLPEVDAGALDPPIAPVPPGGKCDYVATDQGSGGEFGTGCTTNAECKWSECLQPSEGGNLTNDTFGFCTRGCDCGTTETTIPSGDKEALLCLYPPGNQRKWAHITVRCETVADCQALDSRWTACKIPSAGGLQTICHALAGE